MRHNRADNFFYQDYQKHFQDAAAKSLVDLVSIQNTNKCNLFVLFNRPLHQKYKKNICEERRGFAKPRLNLPQNLDLKSTEAVCNEMMEHPRTCENGQKQMKNKCWIEFE